MPQIPKANQRSKPKPKPAQSPARKAQSRAPKTERRADPTERRRKSPSPRTAEKPRTEPGPAVGTRRARTAFERLSAFHPDAHCELDHTSPFQLLVATVLSAQSTDVMVNRITPEVFRRWPTPASLAAANPAEVEQSLNRVGMFRQKTKSIVGLSKLLVERHGGEVPRSLAELIELPGVGRKTANVVLGVAFDAPEGVVVDTHVQRLSQRLGWTVHTEPLEIEQDLMRTFPRKDWDMLSHVLIFHGRRVCTARKPACAACPVNKLCPSAFHAEEVGRKGPRPPRPTPKVSPKAVKLATAAR